MSDAQDKTAALLATLWLKNRPIVDERLVLLDGAAAAAAAGSLADVQRIEAQSAAHKGTRISRQIEVLLDEGAPEPAQLRALVAELRAAVFPAG
jgi:hypothetical protein